MSTSLSEEIQSVAARYYDGNTAAHQDVSLVRENDEWVLRGEEIELRFPLSAVSVSERLGNTPRLLRFSGRGYCEIRDQAGLAALMQGVAGQARWIDHLQHSLPWALAAVLLVAAVFAAGYRYALPWGAEVIAFRLPQAALQSMGSSTLDALDRLLLKPSGLSETRQQQLAKALSGLKRLNGQTLNYRIVFRSSPQLGANAFALANGDIVLLDDLVKLSNDNHEIVAVLAHELGHVERRHAARLLLQGSIVGLVLTWYVGDVSTLLASAPAAVLQARYSRDMEREADDYALRLLQHNGLSGCWLAAVLGKLESAHGKTESAMAKREEVNVKHEDGTPDFFASHPATQERRLAMCPR